MAAEVLSLPVTVVDPGGGLHDVTVRADADARTEQVLAALGLAASTVTCARTGRQLDPDVPIAAAGLVRGDVLTTGAPFVAPQSLGALEVTICDGPASGRRFALPPGRSVLGRDPSADVSIDDPSLSSHHCAIDVDGERVTVSDLESRNGTSIEGLSIQEAELRPGAIARAGRTLFTVRRTPEPGRSLQSAPDGTIAVNRPPRVTPPFAAAAVEVGAPPDEPQKARLPLAASILPVILGVVLWLFTGSVVMLLFTALSPLLAIGSLVENRRTGKHAYRQHLVEYRSGLERAHELDAARAEETAARRTAAPTVSDLIERASFRTPELWERRSGDADFLLLRLGSKSQPSQIEIEMPAGGAPALRAEADQLKEWYGEAPEVPFVVSLRELGAIGLTGERPDVESLARSLVLQAAILHSPADLQIAAVLPEGADESWGWLKWLPHAQLGVELGSLRAGRPVTGPWLLLVIDERVAPSPAVVRDLLAGCGDVSLAVLWLGSDVAQLPGDCRGYVEVDGQRASLAYTDGRTGERTDDVTADTLAVDLAQRTALDLAPLVDGSAAGAASRLPATIPLSSLLGTTFDVRSVANEWERAEGLGAAIGSRGDGLLEIDLRRDGPHGLVAGTTGSGKSEFLQTFVASLALAHPPTRLNFLLIDYKGGSAFQECVNLPHTVGFVTDLDEHLAQRALISLNAELKRREALNREWRVKDLAEFEAREPDAAPAALVIVIDEFATLVDEVPAFVDGVVDVAQRGRSLGVHLVLATQRPSGVVSANIRANTNLRVALQVNGPAESVDVIDAPDAAAIPRSFPGRAYVRTGHDELTLFQTAFVGGVTHTNASGPMVSVEDFLLVPSRGAESAHEHRRSGETELDQIVDCARRAALELELPVAPSPWLPPLPRVLSLAELEQPASTTAVALGLVDEPARQVQRPFTFDLDDDGHLVIYGAGRSGKSTLLRTLAAAFADRLPTEELTLYGLDFGGGGLRPIAELPQCGSIIPGEDEERVERVFMVLQRALDERRAAFAEAGVFTLDDFRRKQPETPMPRLLVLLDGYAAFAATYDRVTATALPAVLQRLLSEGRPFGLHFVLTADRRAAIPSAVTASISTRIALRLNSEDEYAALNFDLRQTRGVELVPGQGFVDDSLVVQTAVVSEDPSPDAQADALRAIGARLAGMTKAVPVRTLPVNVERSALPVADARLHATIGVGERDLGPLTIDLSERHFLVTGSYRSGRTTTLRALAEGLRASDPELALTLIAPRRSALSELPIWTSVAEGSEECDTLLTSFVDDPSPRVIVVDDAEQLDELTTGSTLERLVRFGRDCELRIVVACEKQAARAYTPWARELRKEESGIVLQPDVDTDADIFGVRFPRRTRMVFPPGRGYLVSRGELELVQIGV